MGNGLIPSATAAAAAALSAFEVGMSWTSITQRVEEVGLQIDRSSQDLFLQAAEHFITEN